MGNHSELRYDFWDILKAPRVALSGKSLLMQARPLVYGYGIYIVLTYLSLMLEGHSFTALWLKYTFFPCPELNLTHWYSWALWIGGLVAIAGFYDYGTLAVAKLAFEEFRGNHFFPRKEAAADARGNLMSLWVAGGLIVALIVVLAAAQGIVSLLALIPVIGPILYAVLFSIPFFLWSLFLVFLAFGLVTAILTLPAIVVAREKEYFGATFFIYNLIWSRPLLWVGMTITGVVFAKLGVFIFGYFVMRALQLSCFTGTLFAGETVHSILSAGYQLLHPIRGVLDFLTSLYPHSGIAYDWIVCSGYFDLSGSGAVAAFLVGLALTIILIVVLSYGLNIITISQLLAFLLITFKEDKVKLTAPSSQREPDPHELIPEKPDDQPTPRV